MSEPRAAVVHLFRPRSESPAPVAKAHPVRLNSQMPIEDVFRIVVLECLAQVSTNAVGVRQAREAENLHQLRVALRRLRVALAMFKTYREPAIVDLGKRAAAISDKLGPARDLDVFLGDLIQGPKALDPHGPGFALLVARAEAARERAWDNAVECVAGTGFALFLDDVAITADSLRSGSRGEKPLGKVAHKVLDKALDRVRNRAKDAKFDPHAFHRQRIALKKLRYSCEFLAPLYKEKKVRRYVKHMKALQDLLGDLNDSVHVQLTLSELRETGPRKANQEAQLHHAFGVVEGWYGARTKPLMKSARQAWKEFRDTAPFWN